MNNPQSNSRPQRNNNKGDLNANTTTQYQEGKQPLEGDQRSEMQRENHDLTKEKKVK